MQRFVVQMVQTTEGYAIGSHIEMETTYFNEIKCSAA